MINIQQQFPRQTHSNSHSTITTTTTRNHHHHDKQQQFQQQQRSLELPSLEYPYQQQYHLLQRHISHGRRHLHQLSSTISSTTHRKPQHLQNQLLVNLKQIINAHFNIIRWNFLMIFLLCNCIGELSFEVFMFACFVERHKEKIFSKKQN